MIRVTCPGCGSKLKAKEELLGETRKCPKCGTVVLISVSQTANVPAPATPVSSVLDEPAAGSEIHGASDIALKHEDLPERLERLNHYLICDKSKLVATWENNGQGWMLKTSFGLVSATRTYEDLHTERYQILGPGAGDDRRRQAADGYPLVSTGRTLGPDNAR